MKLWHITVQKATTPRGEPLGELARRQGLELTFGYHSTNKLVEGWYIHKKDVEKP